MDQNKNKRIYLSPPHLNGYELAFVKEAFDTNWIAPLGPHTDAFENEIARYAGVKHALAISSGTAAIHLALKYSGVRQGNYVFCSSFTFAGSCNPIMYEKATPVFIDSEPDSWNMSPAALEKAFQWADTRGKMPKAVIVVNLYGQSADWDRILPICQHYSVPVIEDAAESLGATYKERQTGSFGYFGVFSFNGNKIITTSGGGMVVSNDEDAIKKLKFWATQAREPVRHYEHREIGYNYRLSNICAAIGLGQLKTIDERIDAKKRIWDKYKKAFKDIPVKMMPVMPEGNPNWWLSAITVDNNCSKKPEDIIVALENENIESRPLWKPMHMQLVYKDYPFFTHFSNERKSSNTCKNTEISKSIEVSEDLFKRGICLPSGSAITEEEQERVISVVNEVLY
ncbi:MAG TPA: DegT/DnrJ/EryC1/StrS family aminotransferase [Clostridiales bacterium]|nr:DegT/DnrJ/EryC1/StrS family aminotransferase [Clostridiales bacterium]